jgi:hypothetical protein
MIDQTFQFAVGAGAPPANFMPASFNPVPDDGSLEVWACVDPQGSPNPADTAPTIAVTLGGGTPITPVQPTSIQTNQFGIVGGPPSESTRIMAPQGVTRGTNSQLTVTGGSVNYSGYIRIRFRTLNELSQGLGTQAP